MVKTKRSDELRQALRYLRAEIAKAEIAGVADADLHEIRLQYLRTVDHCKDVALAERHKARADAKKKKIERKRNRK